MVCNDHIVEFCMPDIARVPKIYAEVNKKYCSPDTMQLSVR